MTRRLVALVAAMLSSGVAFAQTPAAWPDRPIRLIVPFTPGSSSDIVARIVAQKVGNMGTEAAARAEPDGYTIGLANASTHAVTASVTTKLGYDPVKDFAPVSMLGSSPFVLATFPGLPARNVAELLALAKAQPHTLTYASAGQATVLAARSCRQPERQDAGHRHRQQGRAALPGK